MKTGRPVDLLLLDAGGVLLLPEAETNLGVLARFGVEADVAAMDRAHYAAMAAVDQAMQRLELGAGGLTSEVWTESLRDVYRNAKQEALGLHGPLSKAVEEALFETPWMRPAPGALDALRAVAARKLPIAVVSNAGGTVEADLKTARICQVGEGAGVCVTAVIDSSVVGVAKPDPAIFTIALEAARTAPERAVFIGDSVAIDVVGAARAGIRGLHFDPFGFCDANGHDDVDRLSELIEILAI